MSTPKMGWLDKIKNVHFGGVWMEVNWGGAGSTSVGLQVFIDGVMVAVLQGTGGGPPPGEPLPVTFGSDDFFFTYQGPFEGDSFSQQLWFLPKNAAFDLKLNSLASPDTGTTIVKVDMMDAKAKTTDGPVHVEKSKKLGNQSDASQFVVYRVDTGKGTITQTGQG